MIKIAVVDDNPDELNKMSDMFERLRTELGQEFQVDTFSDSSSFVF